MSRMFVRGLVIVYWGHMSILQIPSSFDIQTIEYEKIKPVY